MKYSMCVYLWTSIYMPIQDKTHQVLKYFLMMRRLCLSLLSHFWKKKKYLLKLRKRLQEDESSFLHYLNSLSHIPSVIY